MTPKQQDRANQQGGKGEVNDGRRGSGQQQQGGNKPDQADSQKPGHKPQHGGAGQHSTR